MGLLTQALPCPWCEGRGSDKGKPCQHGLWLWDKGVPGKFAIGCSNPDCAATGPLASTESAAVVAWNAAPRRPDQKRSTVRRLLDEANPPDTARELEPGHGDAGSLLGDDDD